MALYNVTVNGFPQASDVNQVIDIFTGKHDVGSIALAQSLSAPGAPNVAIATGSGLGVGAYKYVVTFVTGYKKSDGTIVKTGETTSGTVSATATTTSGNQQINVTSIPVGGSSVVARYIYRTKVGGSTYYLAAQLNDNTTTTWLDNVADAALPSTQPPTSNTTGTTLTIGGKVVNTYANDIAWTQPTLSTGTHSTLSYGGAKYRMFNGMVFMKGAVDIGANTGEQLLFTLPVGYRPSTTLLFGLPGGTSDYTAVYSSGNVQVYTPNGARVQLSVINFIAEQ